MAQITTSVAIDSLGRLLAVWRVATGMSQTEAAERASERLPYPISRELVRRLELGPKNEPDPVVVAALTLAYGHTLGELPESVRNGLAMVDELVKCCHM
jgi:transcriptional regulator with XRE-family HTH domain